MSFSQWINKLKPSETSKQRLRLWIGRGWQKIAFLGTKTGAGFKRVWQTIKSIGERNDTLRSLGIKIQHRMQDGWSRMSRNLPASFPRRWEDFLKIHPQELAEDLTKIFRQGNTASYFKVGTIIIGAYFLADTAALFTDNLIPDPPALPPPMYRPKVKENAKDRYAIILSRNIFNSKGFIPDDLNNLDPNGPARKSTLPLNLIGTVVLQDEIKSIAAIEDKSTNTITPVRVNETLNAKITIKKIEHMKVIFINISSGTLEYIEIPEDVLTQLSIRPSGVSKNKAIEKDGEGRFSIQKTELDKQMNNLTEVLRQAKAIPNFENGVPNGFRIIKIEPNSIYTKLGIAENDVIMNVNGEPINDPGKAFMLLNELKSGASRLELTIKSPDGRVRNNSYDIR